MEVQWFRQDKPAVLDALRRGQRPLMATTMASGPLDELVALHIELGIFEALDALPVARQRDGIADPLLLRTLATLPFLPEAGLDPAAKLLVSGAGPLAPPGVGAGPDPVRGQSPASPSRGETGPVAALPSRHLAGRVAAGRGGGLAEGPGGRRRRAVSIASSCGAGSMPSTAAGWAAISAWSAWSASRAAAGDRGLAAAGGGGLREGPRGGGHAGADRTGVGAGRARLHRAAPGRCPVCRRPADRLAGLREGDRHPRRRCRPTG